MFTESTHISIDSLPEYLSLCFALHCAASLIFTMSCVILSVVYLYIQVELLSLLIDQHVLRNSVCYNSEEFQSQILLCVLTEGQELPHPPRFLLRRTSPSHVFINSRVFGVWLQKQPGGPCQGCLNISSKEIPLHRHR